VIVFDNSPPDTDPTAGQFELDNLALGTYTIQESVPPAGFNGDPFVETIVLTLVNPNGVATHVWVNTGANQGCTPGFWQGGLGVTLWDTTIDPDWTAHGGVGTNPFTTTTLFDSFFTPYSGQFGSTSGKTMLDIVGTGGGSKPANKAARMVVAAYLDASFGLNYPYTTNQITTMWTNAVTTNTSAAFMDVFNKLGAANNLGCPIH
jgi:hypothetical protein